MKELVLIKLGGSVVTNKKKEFTAHGRTIMRLARELKKAKTTLKNSSFIIGHGAGSFAHTPAARYKTKDGLKGKDGVFGMSVVGDAARRLNMIVVNNFLKEKLPVFSFSPASFIFSDTKVGIKSYIDPINHALGVGAIPVVYGDVIMERSTGCTIFSTERVLSILAKKLKSEYRIRMIYCSDVDGVYDSTRKTISLITNTNFDQVKKSISKSLSVDVTGGMLHKVEEALSVSKKYGISTLIINGNTRNQLRKAILGRRLEGTTLIRD